MVKHVKHVKHEEVWEWKRSKVGKFDRVQDQAVGTRAAVNGDGPEIDRADEAGPRRESASE